MHTLVEATEFPSGSISCDTGVNSIAERLLKSLDQGICELPTQSVVGTPLYYRSSNYRLELTQLSIYVTGLVVLDNKTSSPANLVSRFYSLEYRNMNRVQNRSLN
jgi:hypothetical protein